jgi:hypothetical protein
VQAAPAPKRPPTKAGLSNRIIALRDEGYALGLTDDQMAPPRPLADMSEDELIEFGKVLAAAVAAAKEDAAQPDADTE